jgi:hypothetical protein
MPRLGTCLSSCSDGNGHSGGVPHEKREDCREWIPDARILCERLSTSELGGIEHMRRSEPMTYEENAAVFAYLKRLEIERSSPARPMRAWEFWPIYWRGRMDRYPLQSIQTNATQFAEAYAAYRMGRRPEDLWEK